MRFPKPWYRPTRAAWYVTIDGTQHNLGPDQEKALERYHALMARPRPKKVAADSVLGVIARSSATYQTLQVFRGTSRLAQ